MTILSAKTQPAGPGRVDIQIEQGANFFMQLSLKKGGVTWDLTDATFSAKMSPQWSPEESAIEFVVTSTNPTTGVVTIEMSALATASLALPNQPQKAPANSARKFAYGGWIFDVTQSGITQRIIEGDVTVDRDPCQN